jgi:heat shock protein HslJ
MRLARIITVFVLLLFSVRSPAETQAQEVTVMGTLARVMAIGAETSGWSIHTDSEITLDGQKLTSIEVSYPDNETLEKLADKYVKAKGKLSHHHGVETGDRLVLEVASIKPVQRKSAAAESSAFHLAGGEWALEDLAGSGVVENSHATLSFPEDGKVAGNGSCNRFFGTAEIHDNTVRISPLGATRMMCAEPMMNQETKYMSALQDAERFEWKDPYLLIYCKGLEKPLRFTRAKAATQ